jgi:hypothetical protein
MRVYLYVCVRVCVGVCVSVSLAAGPSKQSSTSTKASSKGVGYSPSKFSGAGRDANAVPPSGQSMCVPVCCGLGCFPLSPA